MATKQQAERELAKLGLELSPGSGKSPSMGYDATIDTIGRKSFAGDCRGHVVFDYSAKADAFWDEVISEAKLIAPSISDCPYPEGQCPFHDEA